MVPGAVGHNNPEDHAAFLSGRDRRPTVPIVRGGIRDLDDSAAGALDVRFAPNVSKVSVGGHQRPAIRRIYGISSLEAEGFTPP